MDISAIASRPANAADLPLESLAANKHLSKSEKIAQASRAFEAVLLRQILSESQKPVFPSKYVGNSTSDGIYRDEVVNQLADNISKSGTFGLAQSLTRELQRQTGKAEAASPASPSSHTASLRAGGSKAGPPAAAIQRHAHSVGALSLNLKPAAPNGSGRPLAAPAVRSKHSHL
jgi:Rod binding domain-containing protein